MDFDMITDQHSQGGGYISLRSFDLQNVPEKISVDGYELLKKGEFHVSIIALKNLAPMLNAANPEQASKQLKQDFLEFVKTHDIADFRLTGEYRLVKRDERVTVVAMVELKNINELFNYLRSKHDVDFPTQPTHITMYTLQPEIGIGILSQDELTDSSSAVDVPALANIEVDHA